VVLYHRAARFEQPFLQLLDDVKRRSLTKPGFRNSALPRISHPFLSLKLFNRISGVACQFRQSRFDIHFELTYCYLLYKFLLIAVVYINLASLYGWGIRSTEFDSIIENSLDGRQATRLWLLIKRSI